MHLPTEKPYSLGRHKMFKCWKWSSSDPTLVFDLNSFTLTSTLSLLPPTAVPVFLEKRAKLFVVVRYFVSDVDMKVKL